MVKSRFVPEAGSPARKRGRYGDTLRIEHNLGELGCHPSSNSLKMTSLCVAAIHDTLTTEILNPGLGTNCDWVWGYILVRPGLM